MKSELRKDIVDVLEASHSGFRAFVFRRIVLERTVGGAFEVFELARAERPEKCNKAEYAEEQRGRPEPRERRHRGGLPAKKRRNALAVTRIDEVDMTIAAINGVTKPAIASGTQMTL